MQLNLFDTTTTVKSTSRPVTKQIKWQSVTTPPEEIQPIISLETTYKEEGPAIESGNYAEYRPTIKVTGSKPHPTKLCESLAMSSIVLPPASYKPKLPCETINSGILSDAQLEDIILAGNAHDHILKEAESRQGFMVGSGTGFGKGNTIAGIILDNFNQGRTKAVWISKNDNAHHDSITYWTAVGGKAQDCIDHSKIKKSHGIHFSRGVLITKYGLLKSGFEYIDKPDCAPILKGRIKQLVDWLGTDFDGIIAFDESHMMANAIDEKGDRGIKKSSLVAQVGLLLQRLLPMARIVYSSATGATEINNLVYAERLGLYGPGTSFDNSRAFITQIKKSGVSAMELVARDLKAMGLYSSKSLSYDGVEYDTIVHTTTPPQIALYDQLACAWQHVLSNIDDAIEENATGKNAKSAALSAFWSAHQRFFNLIILTIQFPTVAEDIQNELDAGNAIIIQLTNTNEAQTVRALTKAKENASHGQTLEQLDISPKSVLIEFLNSSFPTVQFEEYIDTDGNLQSRPVTDSEGNLVHNLNSIAKRDAMIEQIDSQLTIPMSPLDSFLNTFGTNNVAEVTGRSLRIVKIIDQETGQPKLIEQRRTPSHIKSEIKDFNDDKRRILIFSEAGGTGGSFHADKRIINQRRRKHYVFQPGWRADVAVQGFGRSHRSNQVVAPEFKLCSTDIIAQKRFLSSIARRLEQLGALTKGQRDTGGQGILDNSYNFESSYAKEALALLYKDILHTNTPISMNELESMMGLKLMKKVEGTEELNVDLLYDIKKFLNRILSLEIRYMTRLFSAFEEKLHGLINLAKSKGNYDEGITHVQALDTQVVEEQVIYEHERSKAKTILTTLKLIVEQSKTSLESIKLRNASNWSGFQGFYVNTTTKKVFAVYDSHTERSESGIESVYIQRTGILQDTYMHIDDLNQTHQKIDTPHAHTLWTNEYHNTSSKQTVYHTIIKGLLLPIWNRIPGETTVNRYIDNDGVAHLGRYIPKMQLPTVRKQFDLKNQISITEMMLYLNRGRSIKLSNGFVLRNTTIQGIPSVEITEIPRTLYPQITKWNMIVRIKNSLMDLRSAHIPKKLAPEVIPQLMSSLSIQVDSIL
ncbi:MAG: strawberry notch family protein [Cyclobacteriaceae bacterium]